MRRALEAQFERQPVDPHVAARTAQVHRFSMAHAHDGAHAFCNHQRADDAQQEHVGHPDGDVELSDRAQEREQPDAEGRADDAACEQHADQRHIDGAAAPVAERARH